MITTVVSELLFSLFKGLDSVEPGKYPGWFDVNLPTSVLEEVVSLFGGKGDLNILGVRIDDCMGRKPAYQEGKWVNRGECEKYNPRMFNVGRGVSLKFKSWCLFIHQDLGILRASARRKYLWE